MALIVPKPVDFSESVMDRMWKYVEGQVDYLLMEGQTFRETILPEWTRLLKGAPKSPEKNFPFPGASNLVVQLIATRVEQMLSRAMVIYGVDPLWNIIATGDLPGQETDEQAKVLEQFMGDMAVDPAELNLYRQEELMFHDGIAYGTSYMAFPHQYLTEEEYVYIPGGESQRVSKAQSFRSIVKKDGPAPEALPIDDILVSNKVYSLEKAKFVARIIRLKREAIEDRIAFGTWSQEDGEKILANPDTLSQSYKQLNSNDSKQIYPTGSQFEEEYKIYQCHFKFVHDKKTFSIIAEYHKASGTRPSAVFNYFPKNAIPLEDLRFGYDTSQYLGYGFIEMLKYYQEEVTTLHNNRLDNEAIRNNITFRIDPDSELASTLKFYPGVGVQAKKDEVEVLNTWGAGAIDNGQSEGMATSMANERSGIDPAMSGMGSGIVNPKRGIYSSQGTLAVLQQQNNRTGLRMMDIRGTHVKIGRKLLDMYAFMGIGNRLGRYGAQAPTLRKGLDSVKAGNLGLILKAASASQNQESDRQNSILLQGLQEKYVGTVNQILQALEMPQTNESTKKFLVDTLFAEQALTRHIFRVFGHADVDKLVPFPESIKNARFSAAASQQGSGGPQQASGGVPSGSSVPSGGIPTIPSSDRPQ